jgi:type VI secretion system protein ImpE
VTVHAQDALAAGDLGAALAALQRQVRERPADAKLRVFLFQLLCVNGDWNRAIMQLKVAAELDSLALAMAQTYREAIICEVYRERVFAGEKTPLVFGEPQDWIALSIEALRLLAAGRPEEAAALRERAFEAAPATAGALNGAGFAWIADADMRLGPLLEIIVDGRYFWAPFAALREIRAEGPVDLRDLVWTPVTLALHSGSEVVGLVPTRYAGTAAEGDDAARLARRTEWIDAGGGTFRGIGQRLLATDAAEVGVLDLRTLALGAAAATGEGVAASAARGADG